MDEVCPEAVSSSQPCTPMTFNPMTPSTSRVGTPVRPASRSMSSRQYPGSPFRAHSQNMEPSNARVQELRVAAAGKRSYTSEWMDGGYRTPPPATANGPGAAGYSHRPPSVMGSTMSTASGMSNMTNMTAFSTGGMSMLSVNTECWDTPWLPVHQNVSSHPSAENQNPMNPRIPMTPMEIAQNLRSHDVTHQVAALRELEPVVKNGVLVSGHREHLQPIIHALFEVLVPRQNENDIVIRKTAEILVHLLTIRVIDRFRKLDKTIIDLNGELMDPQSQLPFPVPRPYSIYEIVMERVRRVDTKYDASSMLLLIHLCCKPYILKHVFDNNFTSQHHARVFKVIINFAIHILGSSEAKPKTRSLAATLIKNLSRKNCHIMGMAKELDVVSVFLKVMKDDVIFEELMWCSMQALTLFCSDASQGEIFVQSGGAQVLCGLLDHGSTRLLHELLGCMNKVADLPAIQGQDMKQSIHSIVQLMGSSDPLIVERATGTLRNIGLHNKMNKVFMVQNGVTNHALTVLRTSAQIAFHPSQNKEAVRMQLLSIYENCLSILNNVTSMAPTDIKECAVQACHMIAQNTDSALILLNFFHIGTRKCRKVAVSVMKRVIENVPAFAEPFVDLVDLVGQTKEKDTLPTILIQRAWDSMTKWHKVTVEQMSTNFGPETPQRRQMVERAKDHEDIARRSVGLLTTLCTKANPRFFEIIKETMKNRQFNPFKMLWHEMCDAILLEWLNFILETCSTKESSEQFILTYLINMANSDPDPSNHVTQKLNELHERRPNLRESIIRIANLHQLQQQKIGMHPQQQKQPHI